MKLRPIRPERPSAQGELHCCEFRPSFRRNPERAYSDSKWPARSLHAPCLLGGMWGYGRSSQSMKRAVGYCQFYCQRWVVQGIKEDALHQRISKLLIPKVWASGQKPIEGSNLSLPQGVCD